MMQIKEKQMERNEQITNEVAQVLNDLEQTYSTDVVRLLVQKSFLKKQALYQVLSKHPNWNEEKLQIQFDKTYTRCADVNTFLSFINKIRHVIRDMTSEMYSKMFGTLQVCNDHSFWDECDFAEALYWMFADVVNEDTVLTEKTVEWVNKMFPELKARKGQKVNRVFNKFCILTKLNSLCTWYNKEYAKASDGLSPITYTRHTVVSINPVDYLLIANGNSWSSCMTIDTKQIHQTQYRGESAAGCISYMLDGTTMVFYTVTDKYDGAELELQPKELRQLFSYSEGKLLQSRLYPQSNDGNQADEMRQNIRTIVQTVIADCLSVPNLWKLITRMDHYLEHVETNNESFHYPDYEFSRNKCSVSLLDGVAEDNKIVVGATSVCINCGGINKRKWSLICNDCDDNENYDDDEDY